MRVVKPPKYNAPTTTISHALKKYEKAKRDLSDTLSKTSQFELKKTKDAIAKTKRDYDMHGFGANS